MNKWVTEELVMEFIREKTDIDLSMYIINMSKEDDGEICCYAMYMCGDAYFRDFEFGGEWFEGIILKNSSGDMKKVSCPKQEVWREFLTEKFGQSYVEDYKEFMWQYFEKRQEELNNDIKAFDQEMRKLENF